MTALAVALALSWVLAAWQAWRAYIATDRADIAAARARQLRHELDDANDRLNAARYYAHRYFGANLADGRTKILDINKNPQYN